MELANQLQSTTLTTKLWEGNGKLDLTKFNLHSQPMANICSVPFRISETSNCGTMIALFHVSFTENLNSSS